MLAPDHVQPEVLPLYLAAALALAVLVVVKGWWKP